jgi:eukaryotic-like serine/threonine-protein kinase
LLSEQGPMPSATAARLLRQVALGLDHAHRKGLIHRDVNPYNILVTYDGTAKLADMGLAIAMAEEDRVTHDGATVGTFDYIAPEQARHSRSADIRSDIYSLGCTIYHMCTGHVPFPGPSLPEKLFGHQAVEPTPLCRVVSGLPEGLSEVVQRMMRKAPEERYATPMQVARALEPYADGHAGVAIGKGEPPLLEPRGVPAEPPLREVAHRYQPAGSAGLKYAPDVATNPNSRPYAADTGVPLLTPDDDANEPSDEIRLILDTSPELSLSEGRWRPKPPSSATRSHWADVARGPVRWLTPFWLWVTSRVGGAAHRFGRDPGDG